MDEPALTEAVKTDFPSPKPNRRKRLALRFAALVAAVSALGAAYWFTRPPELVWWRSAAIASTGRHARALIPAGWINVESEQSEKVSGEWWTGTYHIISADTRPPFLRWMHRQYDEGTVQIIIDYSPNGFSVENIGQTDLDATQAWSDRSVDSRDHKVVFRVIYYRANVRSFNRTYRQICDSLRIE